MTDDAGGERLTHQVRELLSDVLGHVDFPGRDELLHQVMTVKVTGGPVTMLDLRVIEPTQPSALTDGAAPLSATVFDDAGTSVGELLLWVESGFLSVLEFAWWSDDPPERLPDPDRVRTTQR